MAEGGLARALRTGGTAFLALLAVAEAGADAMQSLALRGSCAEAETCGRGLSAIPKIVKMERIKCAARCSQGAPASPAGCIYLFSFVRQGPPTHTWGRAGEGVGSTSI